MRRGFALSLLLGFCAAALADDRYDDGYRRGYQDGFRDGQRSAERERQRDDLQRGALPQRGIVILSAVYGDGFRRCDATAALAGRFNGRPSASFDVTNQLCGDPAPGARKQLAVDYLCAGQRKAASAFEHRSVSLECY